MYLVPVVGLDHGFQFVGALLQVADDFRPAAIRDVDGLASHGQESASAFLVDLSGELIREIDVGLIALHHPLADGAARRQLDAADLDATVRGIHPELHLQLEVGRLAAAPDQKGVLLERILVGTLANDLAVLRAPERRITVPAFQARTVEDRLEPGVIPEDERVGAAGPVAASAPATALLPRRRRLRGNRRDHGEHQHTEHDLVHTAPACCVTATLSQRPLFADFNTASVT